MCVCVCILLYSSCNSILRSKGGHILFFFSFSLFFILFIRDSCCWCSTVLPCCVCVYTQKRDRASSSSSFFIHRFDFVSLYIFFSPVFFIVYASNWNLSFSALWCCGELFRLYTHTVKHPSLFFYIYFVCIYVVICFHAANKFSTMLLYLMIQLMGLWISDKRKFKKEFWQLPSYSICCLYLACIYYA